MRGWTVCEVTCACQCGQPMCGCHFGVGVFIPARPIEQEEVS